MHTQQVAWKHFPVTSPKAVFPEHNKQEIFSLASHIKLLFFATELGKEYKFLMLEY